MSSLGRSFKAQTPLSPLIRARRATLKRAYSNTSERSCTSPISPTDEYPDPFLLSGSNTPVREKRPSSQSSRTSEALSPLFAGNLSSRFGSSARPIPIEMPSTRRANGGPTPTPPEPLSARGDRVGGYFPLHEDPQARVHRPHPFHPENSAKSTTSIPLNPNLSRSAAGSTASPFDTTPVTSYMPSGVHDTFLPMGKYYPSNYEKRCQQGLRPSASTHFTTPAKSDSQVPSCSSSSAPQQSSWNDSDVKRKLQQYQRDMIAQATLAMGSAAKHCQAASVASPTGLTLNGVPMRTQSLGSTTLAKPMSPRLLPMGSPGPVTPMDLESSGGSYLDKGQGTEGEGDDKTPTEREGDRARGEEIRRRNDEARGRRQLGKQPEPFSHQS